MGGFVVKLCSKLSLLWNHLMVKPEFRKCEPHDVNSRFPPLFTRVIMSTVNVRDWPGVRVMVPGAVNVNRLCWQLAVKLETNSLRVNPVPW